MRTLRAANFNAAILPAEKPYAANGANSHRVPGGVGPTSGRNKQLCADNFGYANPGKNDLIVKGSDYTAIGYNVLRQRRNYTSRSTAGGYCLGYQEIGTPRFQAQHAGELNALRFNWLNCAASPYDPGKAGGILCADNFGYANPGKNDLIVKGSVRHWIQLLPATELARTLAATTAASIPLWAVYHLGRPLNAKLDATFSRLTAAKKENTELIGPAPSKRDLRLQDKAKCA